MKTHVAFILDRSGSMSVIKQATVDGTVEFVKELKEKGGDVHLTLVAFDAAERRADAWGQPERNPVQLDSWADDVPIADVKPKRLMAKYMPRGWTPLYDAIGITVEEMDDKVKKGEKAIVVVMTDGIENASRTWQRSSVKQLIKRLEKKGNWTFVFLGANIDAPAVAEGMGVPLGNTMSYSATPDSVRSSMRGMSAGATMTAASLDSATSTVFEDAGQEQDVREEEEKAKAKPKAKTS